MVVDVDVLSIINVLRILGESPELHSLLWDMVASVGLHQEAQCTPGSDREDLVDGRALIETSSVGKSPSVLVLHLAVDVLSEESRPVQTEEDLPLSHLTMV